MTLDLQHPPDDPSDPSEDYWTAISRATAHLDPPIGVLHRDALAWNAHDLQRRAAGTPIRVASKSVRVRGVLEAVLALPGFHGVLAYTLPEAIWLARCGIEDVVVAYPSVHRSALRELAHDAALAEQVTIMVDDIAQLDVVDAVAAPAARSSIRVALELDVSMRAPILGHVGVQRSPLRDAAAIGELAEHIVRRQGFDLVGIMAYEAQIAGVPDAGPGAVAIRAMQRASVIEVAERRGEAVARVRDVVEAAGRALEFVNGGGSGSVESTGADPSVTEIAAGSALFGSHLFDHYRSFHPAPAASFVVSVVRRPEPHIATLLGAGWIASGPPGDDRLPQPAWPAGLEYLPREGAGEVQTPVRGDAAAQLAVGARVWMRHAKAGEIAEHLDVMHVVHGDEVVTSLPTYRGEGKAFL